LYDETGKDLNASDRCLILRTVIFRLLRNDTGKISGNLACP